MKDLVDYEDLPTEKLRNQVLERLAANFSQDNLNIEEYENRTGLAHKASRKSQLIALVEDLPSLESGPKRDGGRVPQTAGDRRVSIANRQRDQTMFCIFSGIENKGVWTPAETINVITVFGGADLDFRRARLGPGVTRIHVVSVFGGTQIIVPPDVNVEVHGVGIFGGFTNRGNDCGDPDAPTLRIDGIAVFGGTDIKVKG